MLRLIQIIFGRWKMFQQLQDLLKLETHHSLWFVVFCPLHCSTKSTSVQQKHSFSVSIGWQAHHLHHQSMPVLILPSAPGSSTASALQVREHIEIVTPFLCLCWAECLCSIPHFFSAPSSTPSQLTEVSLWQYSWRADTSKVSHQALNGLLLKCMAN